MLLDFASLHAYNQTNLKPCRCAGACKKGRPDLRFSVRFAANLIVPLRAIPLLQSRYIQEGVVTWQREWFPTQRHRFRRGSDSLLLVCLYYLQLCRSSCKLCGDCRRQAPSDLPGALWHKIALADPQVAICLAGVDKLRNRYVARANAAHRAAFRVCHRWGERVRLLRLVREYLRRSQLPDSTKCDIAPSGAAFLKVWSSIRGDYAADPRPDYGDGGCLLGFLHLSIQMAPWFCTVAAAPAQAKVCRAVADMVLAVAEECGVAVEQDQTSQRMPSYFILRADLEYKRFRGSNGMYDPLLVIAGLGVEDAGLGFADDLCLSNFSEYSKERGSVCNTVGSNNDDLDHHGYDNYVCRLALLIDSMPLWWRELVLYSTGFFGGTCS